MCYRASMWPDNANSLYRVYTLSPRENGRHFADDIFKSIFLNENFWIRIEISLKFVPKGPINNIPALVQIMPWCCSGDKPLSEPMMVCLPTHICVTGPQWVKMDSLTTNTVYSPCQEICSLGFVTFCFDFITFQFTHSLSRLCHWHRAKASIH